MLIVGWYKIVLSSAAYNFRTGGSSISWQATFNSNFSRNIYACLDLSFGGKLALRGYARVIYTYASSIYHSETDIAYN
jgi:hypothetical protein